MSVDTVINVVLESVWFSLPIYMANVVPVLVKGIPFLNTPIDLGKTWRGVPIFGSHKTFRGFFFGILSAIIIVWIQTLLFSYEGFWNDLSIISYADMSVVFLGTLLGFGALAGDAIKSFFKRRIGIASGKPWPFFDQVDYVLGALICVSWIFVPSWYHIVTMITLGLLASFVSSYFGYYLGFKESKV